MARSIDFSVTLGKRLRALRKAKDLTQEELAEKAGINGKYYTQVERGQRNISLKCLKQISDGLDVPLLEIFRFTSSVTLLQEDEELFALVTLFMAEGNKKSKRAVSALLKEMLKK